MPRFIMRGQALDIDKSDVERALRSERPEPIRTHGVDVSGRRFPVKQALGAVLAQKGFARIDFTSADARRILRRLGFKLFAES